MKKISNQKTLHVAFEDATTVVLLVSSELETIAIRFTKQDFKQLVTETNEFYRFYIEHFRPETIFSPSFLEE